MLVDGGLLNNVPADIARAMGADLVVGVDLNADHFRSRPPENILDVMLSSLYLLIRGASQQAGRKADILVAPDLRGFSYHNLSRLEEMIARGEQAMRAQLDALRRRLQRR